MSDIPKHIAVIMDGNGRWAKERGLPRTMGHKRGIDRVEELVKNAQSLGVRVLTLFAFSTENWSRPGREITTLFGYMIDFLKKKSAFFIKQNVRVRFIGRRDRLPVRLLAEMEKMEKVPAEEDSLIVNVALDYGGRDDILGAVRSLAQDLNTGRHTVEDIDEETFSRYLALNDQPYPDLLIRTSGEQRISNFLLWQLAYTELYFTSCFWPDFDRNQFEKALRAYGRRERRFGAIMTRGRNKENKS